MASRRTHLWRFRGPAQPLPDSVDDLYHNYPLLFTMKIHHQGHFTQPPGRCYVDGMEIYVDLLDAENLCIQLMDQIMEEIGYDVLERTYVKMYFRRPDGDLQSGLQELLVDEDVQNIRNYVDGSTVIEVYLERDGAWTSPHNRPFIWV